MPIFSQTNNIIECFETEAAIGVRLSSNNDTITIIPSTFDYIDIIDSMEMIEARRYSLVPGDSTKRLPAPVIEYYTFNGDLMFRNINLLLDADTDGIFCTEYQKRYFTQEMDIALMMKEALKEKENGRRREAYQKFMAIYRKYPNFELAKESANEIKATIHQERIQTIQQMNRESAERAAAYQQLAASLQQLSSTIAQLNNKPQANTKIYTASTSSQTDQEPTSSDNKEIKYKRYSSTTKTTKSANRKSSISHRSKFWCFEKKLQKCTLCNGSGKCVWCYDGGNHIIGGSGYKICKYCKGSNLCQRCKGAKQIYL